MSLFQTWVAFLLSIHPSVHQSSLIPFNSSPFDLFSHPSLLFGTHHYYKVTLEVSCPVPSCTRWKLRCMSSIYPSISGERPQWHAITLCQHSALQTIYSIRAARWAMATLREWHSKNEENKTSFNSVCSLPFPVFFIWGYLFTMH